MSEEALSNWRFERSSPLFKGDWKETSGMTTRDKMEAIVKAWKETHTTGHSGLAELVDIEYERCLPSIPRAEVYRLPAPFTAGGNETGCRPLDRAVSVLAAAAGLRYFYDGQGRLCKHRAPTLCPHDWIVVQGVRVTP